MIAGYFSSDSFYPLGCEIREVPLRGFRLVGRVFSMRVAKGISGGTCYAKRLKDELVEVAKNMDANVVGVDVNDGQFYYFFARSEEGDLASSKGLGLLLDGGERERTSGEVIDGVILVRDKQRVVAE